MRVLWITNIILPDAARELDVPEQVTGGWMSSLAASLINNSKIELAVATVYKGSLLQKINTNGIRYYLLPHKKKLTKYTNTLEFLWIRVKNDFMPDIVHIHGTELPLGLAYIRACGTERVILSIQGLVSGITDFYYAGITRSEIFRNITFRDLICQDNIIQQRHKMSVRGTYEKEYIKSVSHIIGRTSFDKTYIWALNNLAQYYFCNETLRGSFYDKKWNYDKCDKHTIFVSQGSYPIKGLHNLLKAMPLVLREYPDTRLLIAGLNITDRSTLIKKIKYSGYGKYIISLIRKYKLTNSISFLGLLNEAKMCEMFLSANVFVCPSAIENSPNSLGEAQLLGVPCIASYVGGIPDMVINNKTGFLFRFEETEMLAAKLFYVFSMKKEDLVLLSNNERISALERHNHKYNTQQLINIYNKIHDFNLFNK